MWIHLKDGWRDESDEGPYTETLQTKDDWTICRLISRHRDSEMYELENRKIRYKGEFDTIEDAKKYVREFRERELFDQFMTGR
jgi:hypothetical protein